MNNKKQPQTKKELQADITSHPNRGKIKDSPVVNLGRKELEASVPRQLWNLALKTGAAFGLNQDEILTAALKDWVTNPDNVDARKDFVEEKADKHCVSELEINSKIFGSYKDLKRRQRLTSEKSGDRHDSI